MSRVSVTLVAAFVILGAYCLNHSFATRTGIIGQSKNGCGGSCHGFSRSTNTTVVIWSDSSQLTVGKQYKFHISVINPIQTQVSGGCDISVDNSAKLAVNGTGSGLQSANGELTHTSPKAKSGDSITWTFLYTPTRIGTAHIYAAGNAVNGDGHESSADMWNTTTFQPTVVAAAPIPNISVPVSVRSIALLGMPDTQTVTVKNTGTATLNLTRFVLDRGSAWSIVDSSAHSVAAGDSAKIKVQLAATSLIAYPDTLRISSNVGETPAAVALNGLGAAATIRIDNPGVAFGQHKIGSPDTIFHAYIFNIGTGPMTVSQNKITSASGAFTLVKPSALPATLGKGGGLLIDSIKFSPSKVGLDTAWIQLSFTQTDTTLRTTTVHDTTILVIGEGISGGNQAVTEAPLQMLSISPNPTHGVITIQSSSDLSAACYDVVDAVGRAILTQQLNGSTLDLSTLPNGAYFLRITPKQSAPQVRRIVIEH